MQVELGAKIPGSDLSRECVERRADSGRNSGRIALFVRLRQGGIVHMQQMRQTLPGCASGHGYGGGVQPAAEKDGASRLEAALYSGVESRVELDQRFLVAATIGAEEIAQETSTGSSEFAGSIQQFRACEPGRTLWMPFHPVRSSIGTKAALAARASRSGTGVSRDTSGATSVASHTDPGNTR